MAPRLAEVAVIPTPEIGAMLAATPVSTTYRVTVDGRQAVLRVDGPGAAQLGLDRAAEVAVLGAVAAAGLGPACLASDLAAGTLLTTWLPGRPLTGADLRDPAHLVRAADLLSGLHALPATGPVLDLPVAVDRYARLAGAGAAELAEATRAALRDCRADGRETTCLCHNDPTPGNFIAGEDGRLWLIDWEYAALGDPAFDLAGLAEGAALDRAADDVLLAAYFRRPATAPERGLHRRWRRLAGLLAALWSAALGIGNQ